MTPFDVASQESWHCLRCLNGFDTECGEAYGAHDKKPCCPGCGWDNAVERGELPSDRAELPHCCDCDAPYDEEAIRLGNWDTTDMESPVCRPCIEKWTRAGAGYYECTGCRKRLLAAQVITHPQHLRRVRVQGTRSEEEHYDHQPCGQWMRDAELSPPVESPELKSVGGSTPLALLPLALSDITAAIVLIVVSAWIVAVWLLWRARARNGGPP